VRQHAVPIRHGASLLDSEKNQVGVVTSCTVSPSTKRAIMLAYVDAKFLDKELSALVRDAPRRVRIASLPFVPKRYKK
jgi:glycine cleavage system aminomethyltransferase T